MLRAILWMLRAIVWMFKGYLLRLDKGRGARCSPDAVTTAAAGIPRCVPLDPLWTPSEKSVAAPALLQETSSFEPPTARRFT
eukprot:35390-Prorocentrum_minimum.AAC.1